MCICDHMCYCIITSSVAINLHALYLLLYSLFREKHVQTVVNNAGINTY